MYSRQQYFRRQIRGCSGLVEIVILPWRQLIFTICEGTDGSLEARRHRDTEAKSTVQQQRWIGQDYVSTESSSVLLKCGSLQKDIRTDDSQTKEDRCHHRWRAF